MASRKITPKAGDVFELPLSSGKRGYGHVLATLLMGFTTSRPTSASPPRRSPSARWHFACRSRPGQ